VPTEHRAIVAVDVASFTDPARTLAHLRSVQEGLYDMLRAAFDEAGILWKTCHVEDRGDGAMILVPPEFPKLWLADQWPSRLLSALREYNARASEPARVQLRVALHHGEVYANDDGVVSQAVNHAFRILDAKPAKTALASTGATLALIASNAFYQDVVSQEPAADPGAYRRIAVSVKQTETVAWLRLPDMAPKQHDNNHMAVPLRPMTGSALFAIVDALLELPFVRDQGGRAMLIDLLHPDIAGTVAYHPVARLHVLSLVKTCMRHEHGLTGLLEAVRQLDGETSTTVRQIEQIQYQLLPGCDS
jgi:Effector-associated domain 2